MIIQLMKELWNTERRTDKRIDKIRTIEKSDICQHSGDHWGILIGTHFYSLQGFR